MKAKSIDWIAKKEDWCESIVKLAGDIRMWSESESWTVTQQEKQLTEEHLGNYLVPELTIKTPGGYLTVEPVGHNIVGAEGRVDICAFPSLNRMLLILIGDEWNVMTDARVNLQKTWSRETFIEIAKILTSAA